MPLPSPGFACRARSFPLLRKGTNSPHLEKVGMEVFGSSAQAGSESTLVRDVGQITFLLYSVPEWLTNLCALYKYIGTNTSVSLHFLSLGK